MRTVITHFLNEEFLLPWWLKHHIGMFDMGILIDYGSTDNSLDICRTLAPDWRLVRSRNLDFGALACDFEVMQYENEIPGWKIALNTTEFLCCGNLDVLESWMLVENRSGGWINSAVMVDPFPEKVPSYENSLVSQKYYGMADRGTYGSRSRLYHKHPFGAYSVGRHASHWPGLGVVPCQALILWYSYSPWNQTFKDRKLQFANRIPKGDVAAKFGFQHLYSAGDHERIYAELVRSTRDLSGHIAMLSSTPDEQDYSHDFHLVTHQGTMLFADMETGGLRHGAFADSPLNLRLRVDQQIGWLSLIGNDEQHASSSPIIMPNSSDSPNTQIEGIGTGFHIQKLLNGTVALAAGEYFLSAIPEGTVHTNTSRCGEWEQFYLVARQAAPSRSSSCSNSLPLQHSE